MTQGSNITISVPAATQKVPASQSGVTVNYISGLTTIIPVPAQSKFVSGSIVIGNWSFTDTNNVTTTGPMTVTECTGPGTGCTAMANGTVIPGSISTNYPNGITFAGNTTTPYIEASTGSAQFTAGGSLTVGSFSFDVTATGTGSIVSTVSEFDTVANVVLFGNNVNAPVYAYPAAPVSGCLTAGGTCTVPPYQDQPIASTTINSPPAAPVLVPQTGNVSAGQCTTINVLTGATESGTNDTINPASVTIVTTTPATPTNGTAKSNGDGTVTYCNTGGTATTDTFQVTAADTAASPALVSAPVTETINISYNQCSAGDNSGITSCALHQAVILPVTPGQIILSQVNGLPSDFLGSAICNGVDTPGITLNGDAQTACGVVSPMTVTNATGLDTAWTLTGQVTDFNDPAASSLTCDATSNNHCIPGGNLGWTPASAVADTIVPGDTSQVANGAPIPLPTPIPPAASTNPILEGALQAAAAVSGKPAGTVQPNPVVEDPVVPGLHDSPATMCSAASGQSGGTFACTAFLQLLVPASAAEPAVGSYGVPAYTATLTITLS